MLGLSAVALVLSAAAVDCFAPVCPFVRRQGGITWHDSAHPPCATRARRPVIAHMSASSAASELAEAAISKEAIATLQEQGFVVIENAITDELASRALQGCEMMQRNGKLQTLREQAYPHPSLPIAASLHGLTMDYVDSTRRVGRMP